MTNYEMLHSMTKDELAVFLGKLKAHWCNFEDKSVMEAIKCRKWLDKEAEDASKQ